MLKFAKITLALLVMATLAITAVAEETEESKSSPLHLVVMDPLAAPLSCPCVEGYAQRKYEKLAEFLATRIDRDIKLVFSESLKKAMDGEAAGRVDLVIGKDSVVKYDLKKHKLDMKPLAALTGKDGKTTQTGLLVVPSEDPAKTVKDLKGYKLFLGPEDSDEKHNAILALLKDAGVEIPEKFDMSPACSDGASKVLELGKDVRGAAVISSYAKPLLVGCGTIPKGALRVVGETKPVPFITVYASSALKKSELDSLKESFMLVSRNAFLKHFLETKDGFVPYPSKKKPKKGKVSNKPTDQ